MEKLLREAFPLLLDSGVTLEYEGYTLAEADRCASECLRLGRTYAGQLTLLLREVESGRARQVSAAEPIPLMARRGTFVIAGVEKVVVGQLQAIAASGAADSAPTDLAQRRLRLVGQQLEEVIAGPLLADVEAARTDDANLKLPRFSRAAAEFFRRGKSVRKAETTNPLALLSQLRAVVQQDVRLRSPYDVRDVHASHFGRLCILETPEGERIAPI